MKNKLIILLIPVLFGGCTSEYMSYTDITPELIERIEKLNVDKSKTTLKDLLDIDSADKIYINYSQLNFPNAQWSNQDEFMRDMNLTTKNYQKLIFSETTSSIFVVNNNEVTEQYVLRSKIIEISPGWYDPSIAYIAGVWNERFNLPSDSVVIYPYEKKITVFSSTDN